jgi:hypothetical protein
MLRFEPSRPTLARMGYLFGDSEPFPLPFDFLAALESFLSHAARALVLDREVRAAVETSAKAKEARGSALQELETLHRVVTAAADKALPASPAQPSLDYVRQLKTVASQMFEDARKHSAEEGEREAALARSEVQRRRADIRSALAAFLVGMRLPAQRIDVSMICHDAHNDLAAVFTYADGIVAAFTLAAAQVPAWQHPRKVSDFVKGTSLPVGFKRGWFQKSAQPENVTIDDHYLGGFELTDSEATIQLRRKPSEKDSLAFRLRREEAKIVAEVAYPGQPEAEGHTTALDATATQQLLGLWKQLRAACGDVVEHRAELRGVRFGGRDVVDEDLVVPFVRELVAELAPVVLEIAARSSNPTELSLKVETERGRREELYVKKADLVRKLEALSPEQRELFSPLGLDNPSGKLGSVDIIVDS